MKDQRSTIDPSNLQEVVDATVSSKAATLTGQQQYSTPPHWAALFARLLPSQPSIVMDPQCAGGNLLKPFRWSRKLGVDIDSRFEGEDFDPVTTRVTANCVKVWHVIEDLNPDWRIKCQVANPPFGIRWKIPESLRFDDKPTMDSTEFTWRMIEKKAGENGFGFFIANADTIERLKLHEHPWVYLYQTFPENFFERTQVRVGVFHWHKDDSKRPERVRLDYEALDTDEHRDALDAIERHYTRQRNWDLDDTLQAARILEQAGEVIEEEQSQIPPWNIYLDDHGMIRVYLSTRAKVKRGISRKEVERVMVANHCHPLTLTTDVETRRLLNDLITSGFYDIQPEAKEAIESALADVDRVSAPIMPVTQFEKVAYADECDYLTVREDYDGELEEAGLTFTAGAKYAIQTKSYTYEEKFKRNKTHFNQETGETWTEEHSCSRSGVDRLIQVADDNGVGHRFMDHPNPGKGKQYREHAEEILWRIFQEPAVPTIAEKNAEAVQANRQALTTFQYPTGDVPHEEPEFRYYPGQMDYLARVGAKDSALVAADTGCGKSLMAISLIRLKQARRALIIAPQGTLRQDKSKAPYLEDDSDEDGVDQLSQWLAEIRRFAPGYPVYQLFSELDYEELVERYGKLPDGIYVTYYEAFFYNGALESLPESWTDAKLARKFGRTPPPGPKKFHVMAEGSEGSEGGPKGESRWFEDKKLEEALQAGTITLANGKSLTEQEKGDIIVDSQQRRFVINAIKEESSNEYAHGVGKEVQGIRCVVTPCLASRIQADYSQFYATADDPTAFDWIGLDEAHVCANLGAIITQMFLRMEARYRFAFTATPIPNIVTNLFSLMGWIAVPGWHRNGAGGMPSRSVAWPYSVAESGKFNDAFLSVERDYTQEAMNESRNPNWRGKCTKISPVISSPARLLKLLKPNMAFISKEMCHPAVVGCELVDVRVPMGRQQQKLYAHFMNRGNIPAKNPLIAARKQISYLRAICADPRFFNFGGPGVRSNFNPKTIAVLELTATILERGEQVVIVSARIGQTDTIERRLQSAGITTARIDSTVKAADQSEQSNRFKAGKARVLLMGIKCAKAYSFDACPNLIIGSLEYSYGSLHQAKGRVWRVNSKSPVKVYCVLHKHSIEETMYDLVSTKQDAATICLHGQRIPRGFKPVDMNEVLADHLTQFSYESQDEEECESQWCGLLSRLARASRLHLARQNPARPSSGAAPSWRRRMRWGSPRTALAA